MPDNKGGECIAEGWIELITGCEYAAEPCSLESEIIDGSYAQQGTQSEDSSGHQDVVRQYVCRTDLVRVVQAPPPLMVTLYFLRYPGKHHKMCEVRVDPGCDEAK